MRPADLGDATPGILAALPQVQASQERMRARRWPTIGGPVGRRMQVDGRDVLMFGCNDYLGLGADPVITRAARDAVERYGSGNGLNPALAVTSLHRELMEAVSEFSGCEDVLLFNSCTAANCALIPTLVLEGDAVISDELNHRSIIDACRLSRGTRKVYRHGDMGALGVRLREVETVRLRLVITDGMFSMEGEAAPLPEIVRLARTARALVAVDESHAAGVLGPTGRGTIEQFGLADAGAIQTGTFSKAFGAGIGGYVAGTKALIDHLRDQAAFFIFTSGMPIAAAGAALAALRLIRTDLSRLERLRTNVERLRSGLTEIGYRTLGDGPIVPIIIGEADKARALSAGLFARGIYVPALSYPVVPEGAARLRAQASASHTAEDVDQLLDLLRDAAAP